MFPAHSPFGPQEFIGEVVALPLRLGPLTAFHLPSSIDEGGAPVLLVPGYTGSKEDFVDFMPLLAQRGWESWAYSQRGQADSVRAHSYLMEDFRDDLVEVLELLGAGDQPMHVVGHSFGGVVVREAAIARPDLFRSVTLFSSGPRSAVTDPDAAAMMADMDPSVAKDLFIESFPGGGHEARPHEPVFEMHRHRAWATDAENIQGIMRILTHYRDETDALAATGLPAHLVVGERDEAWPREWYQPEADQLGATLTWIPDAEHSAQLENPSALADDLDAFWRSVG